MKQSARKAPNSMPEVIVTTQKLRVFVSSVQKELEDERLIVQNLLQTDPYLSSHCIPVLYEFEPASPDKAIDGCLKSLDDCQVYILIVGKQYGTPIGKISITHAEYRRAKDHKIPALVFIKGERNAEREDLTQNFLSEIEKDDPKYKRFGNVIELQKEVRDAIVKLLSDKFGINPTSDEDEIADSTIEATSSFESQSLSRISWKDLNHDVARKLVAAADNKNAEGITQAEILSGSALRGLVWYDSASAQNFATAAGIVLLAKDPSAVFPQCRILADVYRSTEPDGDPRDHEDIRGPMPLVIERAIDFIDRNTRHPMRVVGLNRVRIDEYPVEALREALVNAAAHRLYDDAGRKITLEVFSDRVVISSPGLPPKPITIPNLRKGKYRPCSRNPVIAQCLSYFHRIEERGSGFRRMRDQMLNHGLDVPMIGTDTGYFQVIFPGPADNLERIKMPETQLQVTTAIEARLNKRQKKIMAHVLSTGSVSTGWCIKTFGVVKDTVHRDITELVQLSLLLRKGSGRSAVYVLNENKHK